jgi:hypothetical protein
MSIFLQIILNTIVPITIMAVIGAGVQRFFRLDIRTLSNLMFYVFGPAVMFKMLYEADISLEVAGQAVLFFIIFFILLAMISEVYIRLRGIKGGLRAAVRNSILFYNSANYAIPLNQLVFAANPFTMTIQLIIMVFQNILPNTLGIYMINAHKMRAIEAVKVVFSFPPIYVIPFSLLCKGFHVPIPDPVYTAINYMTDAFIGLALLTLGAQLGNMKWNVSRLDILAASNVLRLVVSPALGFLVVWLLGLEGLLAQALVLSCAVPTSLSSMLLAVQFDNEPDFASQAVFTSTLLSVFTVSATIALIQLL